jgi:hypothetical protein
VFCIGSCFYFVQRDKNLKANNNELWKGAITKKVDKKPLKKIGDEYKLIATVNPQMDGQASSKSPATKTS